MWYTSNRLYQVNISHTPDGKVNSMLIFQLLRFSNANITNLEIKIPLYVNYRQVIPQGPWDLNVMKSNGKHVFLV